MKTKIEQHPEFQRVQGMIEDAVCQMEVEGGDVRSFAACLLSQASALYAVVHGTSGPDGLPATLSKMVALQAQRDAQDFETQQYGQAGRA
jgi:hypothetical protein